MMTACADMGQSFTKLVLADHANRRPGDLCLQFLEQLGIADSSAEQQRQGVATPDSGDATFEASSAAFIVSAVFPLTFVNR